MIPTPGKQIKQMFWAAFCSQPRRSGLIPLDEDPEPPRHGISSLKIDALY